MVTSRTGRRSGAGGGGGVPRQHNASGNPKMQIIAEGGPAFTVPYAPQEGTLDGVAPVWEQIPRGGRKPLLLRAADTLEQYSFTLIVGHPDPQVDVENELSQLAKLAASGKRCAVRLDQTTAKHKWRITDYSQQTIGRVHGSNAPARAVVSITLTEVSDSAVNLGPLTGGKGGGRDTDKNRPKFVLFKKNMTLREIAAEYYNGNASVWQKIADHNKIRDPKKIKPGTKILLP